MNPKVHFRNIAARRSNQCVHTDRDGSTPCEVMAAHLSSASDFAEFRSRCVSAASRAVEPGASLRAWANVLDVIFATSFDFSDLECLPWKAHPLSCLWERALETVADAGDSRLLALHALLACTCAQGQPKGRDYQRCLHVMMGVLDAGDVALQTLAGKVVAVLGVSGAVTASCLHSSGAVQWALGAVTAHCDEPTMGHVLLPAVQVLDASLACRLARDSILAAELPALLPVLQQACFLTPAVVDAYASLLRHMQQWLPRPAHHNRRQRELPRVDAHDSRASSTFQALAAMAHSQSGTRPTALEMVAREPGGDMPPHQEILHSSTPKDAEVEAQVRAMEEVGLNVEGLPPSLLRLLAGLPPAGSDSDSTPERKSAPSQLRHAQPAPSTAASMSSDSDACQPPRQAAAPPSGLWTPAPDCEVDGQQGSLQGKQQVMVGPFGGSFVLPTHLQPSLSQDAALHGKDAQGRDPE